MKKISQEQKPEETKPEEEGKTAREEKDAAALEKKRMSYGTMMKGMSNLL